MPEAPPHKPTDARSVVAPDTPDTPDIPERWGQWFGRHKLVVGSVALLVLLVATLNVWILLQRRRYVEETDRLRASMSHLERARSDQIVAQEQNKLQLAVVLIRRQAKLEGELHLSVALDSGAMLLEREGALLREMPVQVGSERRIGLPPDTVRLAAPRGVRTVAHVIDDTSSWEVPSWVYLDRGMEPPAERRLAGALGTAVILDGGAIIYAQPTNGPLADSAYVLPGAIRARAEDMRAIRLNLAPGMRVYLY